MQLGVSRLQDSPVEWDRTTTAQRRVTRAQPAYDQTGVQSPPTERALPDCSARVALADLPVVAGNDHIGLEVQPVVSAHEVLEIPERPRWPVEFEVLVVVHD